jgi:hypothetical protein
MLKIEAIRSSETLVHTRNTRRYIQEERNIKILKLISRKRDGKLAMFTTAAGLSSMAAVY